MSAESRRLPLALLLSLLIHVLLLSLTFGGERVGLPGFAFPWKERRMEAPDLNVMLVPAQMIAAEPTGTSGTLVKEQLQQALIEQTVSGGATPIPFASAYPAPIRGLTAFEIVAKTKLTAQAESAPVIATGAVPSKAPLRTEGSADATPTPIPAPVVLAVERSNEPTFFVPPPPPTPPPVIAVAPSASTPETVLPMPRDAAAVTQQEGRERAVEMAKPDPPERDVEQQRQTNQLEAARVEAAKLEAARQEVARIETARLVAAQFEAQRQDVARQAAARVEAARMEAARQEVARLEAVRLEAQRLDATRLAAAQLEAQRQDVVRQAAHVEAARLEAARLVTDRQEAVRQATAQKEATRILAEKEEDARREARRQAMGRTLNEEAAQREAAATATRSPSTLPYSLSTARRFRLLGRTDPNGELVEYAEAWARKIQFNTPVETVRDVAKRPHTNPMVTVAIRSDGSVESVTFVLSSGVVEVDEAIRRIVQSHVYQAFPPGLAREFDVIEVRRTWHFDTAVRLY